MKAFWKLRQRLGGRRFAMRGDGATAATAAPVEPIDIHERGDHARNGARVMTSRAHVSLSRALPKHDSRTRPRGVAVLIAAYANLPVLVDEVFRDIVSGGLHRCGFKR